MSFVIMLSGYAGSGKDAAAALLVDEMDFTRLAFADILKEDVSRVTGVPIEYFTTAWKDVPLPHPIHPYPKARTPRDLLIQHAAIMRAKDNDVYSRQVRARIDAAPAGTRFVISDWRYKSEADAIAKSPHHVVYVRIYRPSVTPRSIPSERDLDDYTMDFIISNSGTLSELRDNMRIVLHHALRTFSHNHLTL